VCYSGTVAATSTRNGADGAPAASDYERAGELRRALQAFIRQTELIARRHGLTNERYQLLLFVKLATRDGGGATVGDLAAELYLAKSTVTQLVRRAENLRLVRRELSDHDARIRYLRLTEEGERRLAAAVLELGSERDRLVSLLADADGI
jgi:DNA-binding MarR family transcriptional regulator